MPGRCRAFFHAAATTADVAPGISASGLICGIGSLKTSENESDRVDLWRLWRVTTSQVLRREGRGSRTAK
jgi:hypothetical protein